MNRNVLIVDDDPKVLSGLKRSLHKKCVVHVAQGGPEALTILQKERPMAVIIVDFKMPVMNGVEFLKLAKPLDPDAVPIMLSGLTELETMIQVVNEGHVFQFLSKPCSGPALMKALAAGLRQHQMIRAEKELLEKTLAGSIRLLTEVLASVSPTAFNRAQRIAKWARKLAEEAKVNDVWQVEIAAMLSQLGFVAMPQDIVERRLSGETLQAPDESMFWEYPELGGRMIAHIPRLEPISEAIRFQEKAFDGTGPPSEFRKGKDIPFLARFLKPLLTFDLLCITGCSQDVAMERMRDMRAAFDPGIFAAWERTMNLHMASEEQMVRADRPVETLKPGMVTAGKIRSRRGVFLLPEGTELTPVLIMRLRNFFRNGAIGESVAVFIPSQGSRPNGAALRNLRS